MPADAAQDTIVARLADILERRGAEAYIGEPVTISQHMLQCADLAERAGADDMLIAAALLHDIGHFTNEFPEDAAQHGIDTRHEDAGARVIAGHFPKRVVDCVRHHVAAKRYLCATDPEYAARLTPASVLSLGLQGGPMSEDEIAQFRSEPYLDDILQVRRWDDIGKDPNRTPPPFSHYRPVLDRVLRAGG